METKVLRRLKRKTGIRSKLSGTTDRPRLSVFKSSVHIYGQLIDDTKQVTVVESSDLKLKKGKKTDMAMEAGEALAKKAIAKKIKKVVFDRNGFRYHGRIKAFADGARKGGLEF